MRDGTAVTTATTTAKPRLAFVGVGWIGLNRMKALLDDGCAEAVVAADPSDEALQGALDAAPGCAPCTDLDAALAEDPDGVVLATPSGLHAEQAVRALEAGKAVFCQKPLGRTAGETKAVVEAARRNDRLLGVDFSYRHARAMRAVRDAVQAGRIGRVYAADLVFHNAYGPASSWARDPDLSGGGCVIDLGIHLVDLLLWTLDEAEVHGATGALFKEGRRLAEQEHEVEDYAQARIELSGGRSARLTCSWHFSAGRDAVIETTFYGTEGAVSFRNVKGSFYDFRAELRREAHTDVLVSPPDAWGGRAAIAWAERLAEGSGYDPGVEAVVAVAETIDRIYGRVGRT